MKVVGIPSKSRPGVTYEVDVRGDIITCTCLSYFHRQYCIHATAVQGLVAQLRGGRVMRPAKVKATW